jgi:hypothetical protein
MASRFNQIVDEIQADPTLAGFNYSTGRLAEKENADWPRIIWIPTGGPITATQNVGGRLTGAGTDRARQFRTVELNCDVNIWGQDVEQAEEMMHLVIAASFRLMLGSIEFSNHTWDTQTQTGADYSARGQKIVLDAMMRIPVIDAAQQLAIVTAETHTGKFIYPPTGSEETVC